MFIDFVYLSKNQLLVSLIFSIVVDLCFTYFLSGLCYLRLSADLVLFVLLLLISLCGRLGCLFEIFLVS